MAAGDAAAVEVFYRRYFPSLYTQAQRATRRDEAFCLDVVQESVLRIIRSIRPVASEAQLMAWLQLVVRTTAYDLLRAERRRRVREALVPVGAPADPAPDVEQLAWLKDQIERLDPQLVHLIELRFTHQWTLARMAECLGLPLGTIDGRLRRALGQLRQRARETLP